MKNVTFGTEAGIQKVVFENVIDVFAGGGMLDVTSATKYASSEPKVIPAGSLIGRKSTADGTHKIVAITTTGTAPNITTNFNVEPLGLTQFDVPFDDQPLINIVLSGTVRVEALPDDEQKNWKAIALKLPRITFVGENTIAP